jgi:hypothetical protein
MIPTLSQGLQLLLCLLTRYTSPAHEFPRLEVAAVAGDVGAGEDDTPAVASLAISDTVFEPVAQSWGALARQRVQCMVCPSTRFLILPMFGQLPIGRPIAPD